MHDFGIAGTEPPRVYANNDVTFNDAGVCGFLAQDPVDYNQTHHSQADTFDLIRVDGLIEGAETAVVS